MLVGRERELGEVSGLVGDMLGGGGRALILRGEAGIGKTVLLGEAGELAGEATVLRSRGVESEARLPFGALRDLLLPILGGREALPAPQQQALEGALALGPPAPGDRLAVCVATLGLLEAAAARQPVLAVVDDIQWLDDASRECVAYAARRSGGSLAMLLAMRTGHEDREWEGIPSAAVGALDRASALELLGATAPDLAPGVREAVGDAADGNPLALVELPATLTAEQRSGSASLERPLAPGLGLEHVYSERIEELSPESRTALLVAAAARTNELAPIDAACRALGSSAGMLEAAESAGLVELGPDRLEFRHPLVRGGAYHGAPAADRRAAHRALAGAVSGEARAWHLADAAVGHNEEAATALEEVAGGAAARRAYAGAADAFERAARLSADGERAAGRLLGAGAAALSAGRADQAEALALETIERTDDPFARASAERLRGVIATWSGEVVEAVELLVQSADGIAEANPPIAASILADAAFASSAAGDLAVTRELSERAYELMGDADDPMVRAPVLAILSWARILNGDSRGARPLIAEALELIPAIEPLSPPAQIVYISLNCRLPFEDYERALEDHLAVADAARESGSLFALANPLCMVTQVAHRMGRWDGLMALCDEAVAAAEETTQWGPASFTGITRARLAAATGDEALCRADTTAAISLGESAGVASLPVYAHGALGFLELTLGNVDAAIDELEATERLAAATGLQEPTIIPWAPDLVEAYLRAGRGEDASRVLATLERQAEAADTGGAAALAERCRGLAADDGFDDHFAAALEHDERGPMPFERARTELAWGMRLHRARRRTDARTHLRAAAEGFEALGAKPWAELARSELRAAGGRQRKATGASDELTAQEERIARAAGAGATTREIAAELYLSPKTIEFHLSRAYRKLGVRSRAELATALAREDGRAKV